jgi:hypothetical protein
MNGMDRRSLIRGATAATLLHCTSLAHAAQDDVLTPEMFGAKGDGVTNDTLAFRRLSKAVEARRGGEIVLRPRTYLVGLQNGAFGPYAFAPVSVIQISRCSQPVVIRGNGATLKCASGLRYGTFDAKTGRRFDHPMPFTQPGYTATPYDYMVAIRECSGPVTISDLELDGSVETLLIGGQWGDTGWQIAAVGLFLADNHGGETVTNVHSHHHAQDGMMVRGTTRRPGEARRMFGQVRCELNGRQGCSLIGGTGYTFTNCRFAETAMVKVQSAPAAGFDIEQEGDPIRDIRFYGCEFSGNSGVGLVADSGDSADVRFEGCRFIGTANWAVWPRKPFFRFIGCHFVGPIVNCWTDANPERATQFFRCTFVDTAVRPRKGGSPEKGPIANLGEGRNVLFSDCRFSVSHGWALPWSVQAIYENCTMQQRGGPTGFPRGTYRGKNTIVGSADLYNSRILGRVTINGKLLTS